MINAKPISTTEYWDSVWRNADVPFPVDPWDQRPGNYFYRLLHRRFAQWLADVPTGATLIEVGCGGSRWLPYFSRVFGMRVSGIDYSKAGCQAARDILNASGEQGEIVEGDLFSPPAGLIGRFDVVVSFGVIEHFRDTAGAVSACAAFLKENGRIITAAPTMRGLYGLAHRIANPALHRMHVPLTREDLAEAHRKAGFADISAEYVLGLPGIISPPQKGSRSFLRSLGWRVSTMYWRLEDRGFGVPPNRWSSPYCICLARK